MIDTPAYPVAVITGVNGVDGDGRGAASGITYDIAYSEPGQGVQTFPAYVPVGLRLPDTVLTQAAREGDPAIVVHMGQRVAFMVIEQPAIEECST